MILGICGSPRSKGTEYALKTALQQLDADGFETQFWGVKGKQINFCTHCDYCLKRLGCIIQDDIQRLYPLLHEAEAYVIASPVYSGSMSAQLKTVIDRSRGFFAQRKNSFHDKPGIAIAVGGDRSGGQELVIQQITTFYTMNGAITLSGGVFGANLGASFWSKDTLEGLKADEEGFRSLERTVKRLSKYLKERNNE